jgi:hypothetical protein
MDLETRVRHTHEARAAAGWSCGLAMFAAFAYGVVTEDETGYWLLFVVSVIGIGAFIAIDNHLDRLKLALAAARAATTDEERRWLEPSLPGPSAAENPTLVASIIGLATAVVAAIMGFA